MEYVWSAAVVLAQAGEGAQEVPSKSLLQYIHEGGTVTYVLVVLSLVAVALIIRNVIVIRPERLAPPEDLERLDMLLKHNDVTGALGYATAAENNSFLTRVVGASLLRCSRSPFGFLEMRSALEESGQREADRLHRFNDGIGIIAAVAPMLGLLGTVIGMIGAFSAIGTLEGAARSHQLAVSMSLALISTAVGLMVAIPCTVAFALFRRRIDRLVAEVAENIEHLARNVEQVPAQALNPGVPAGSAGAGAGAGSAAFQAAGSAAVPAAGGPAVPSPRSAGGSHADVGAKTSSTGGIEGRGVKGRAPDRATEEVRAT